MVFHSIRRFQMKCMRFLCLIFFLCILTGSLVAQEKEARILADSILLGDTVMVNLSFMSNASGNTTQMKIDVYPGDSPIEIKKIEWERVDTIWNTLEPISMTLEDRALSGHRIFWRIDLDFDYTQFFNSTDRLIVYTDKGKFINYTSEKGKLENDIRILTNEKNDLTFQLNKAQNNVKNYRSLWIIFLILTVSFLILLAVFIKMYLKIKKKLTVDSRDYGHRLKEITELNQHLENQNAILYRNRLDTINKLCEDYYNKNDSDNMRAVLYNDWKNYILSFKSKKKIEEIQAEIDNLQGNLISRIKEQLPNLNSEELTLITYIAGGFSAKAISLFTDINIKQFYYRRQKLIQQILDSDAPDKEFFASKI